MRKLSAPILGLAAALLVGFAPLAQAKDDLPQEAMWQLVVSSQITAFRQGDAPGAFDLAGADFQQSFRSPGLFFRALVASGYAPIMTSRDHRFGSFELKGPGVVKQVVQFIGPRHEIYEGVYVLVKEMGGWRVRGVMLTSPRGVAI